MLLNTPEPTHGVGKIPYSSAASIIDWKRPCPSIFDTSSQIYEKYGLRAVRPLAISTLNRIAKGIDKYIINSDNPFIINDKAATIISYHSEQGNEVRAININKPLHTIDTSNRFALILSSLCVLRKGMDCKDLRYPLPTVTTNSDQLAEVCSFLVKHNQNTNFKTHDTLNGLSIYISQHPINIKGTYYNISDIGMRMLTPRELYNGHGFPTDYIIDYDCKGNYITKTKQISACGNSVPPAFAEALVRANLPELCFNNRNEIESQRQITAV